MYLIRRTLVWMRRFRHCRGFGVQSPSDYGFIRYVINEHYPYYNYSRLEHEITDIDRKTRKLCRLLLRIANFCQADCILDFSPDTEAYGEYFKAGCRKSGILRINGGMTDGEYSRILETTGNAGIIRISLTGNCRGFLNLALNRAHDGSILIIQGIKRDKEARMLWKDIMADERCTVTFDLYYCGIIIIDKKRYKQNYIVNF